MITTVEGIDVEALNGAACDDGTLVRLIILDDRPLFAESMASAMAREPDVQVLGVGTVNDLTDVLSDATESIVLLSFRDGSICARPHLSQAWGERRVVVLADTRDRTLMEQVLIAGAKGVVDQSITLRGLVDALRTVNHGQTALPSHVLAEVISRSRSSRPGDASDRHLIEALSPREVDILELLSRGRGTRAISEDLYLSVSTVRTHIQNILGKLEVHSRLEAVARARELGLIGQNNHAD